MRETWLIILLILLVFLSAFFSGSEIAYAVANKARLRTNVEKKKKRAKLAFDISENYTSMISSILVGNNLVNIASSSIATILFIGYFGESLGPVLAAIIMTAIILIFGEILPKLYAKRRANSLIYVLALPLRFFSILFKPITFVVDGGVNFISKLWTPKKVEPSVTDDELVSIVETIEDEGIIDEEKSDLIKSAIKFSDTTAYEVMVPRVDVVSLDIDDANEKLVPKSEVLQYSYLPVYEETIDNIIGVINVKKLLKKMLDNEEFDVRKLLEEPLYVHETKAVDELIKEMINTKMHMAIVVDEFGGVDGIVTSEDILEELVGDIFDEKDEIEYEYEEKGDGIYIVDGDLNIYDLFELVDLNDKDFDSEYTTVGGWITEMLERFPEPGDEFDYKNLHIEVLSVDDVRVEKARVTVNKVEEEE